MVDCSAKNCLASSAFSLEKAPQALSMNLTFVLLEEGQVLFWGKASWILAGLSKTRPERDFMVSKSSYNRNRVFGFRFFRLDNLIMEVKMGITVDNKNNEIGESILFFVSSVSLTRLNLHLDCDIGLSKIVLMNKSCPCCMSCHFTLSRFIQEKGNLEISFNVGSAIKGWKQHQKVLGGPVTGFVSLPRKICIYQTLPPSTKCNASSMFKLSTPSLNSMFSFSKTSCLIKAKESSLIIYPWLEGKHIYSCLSQERQREVKKKVFRPRFELGSPIPFSRKIPWHTDKGFEFRVFFFLFLDWLLFQKLECPIYYSNA